MLNGIIRLKSIQKLSLSWSGKITNIDLSSCKYVEFNGAFQADHIESLIDGISKSNYSLNFMDYQQNLAKLEELKVYVSGDWITDDLFYVMTSYLKDLKSIKNCELGIHGHTLKSRSLNYLRQKLKSLNHIDVTCYLEGKNIIGYNEDKMKEVLKSTEKQHFFNQYNSLEMKVSTTHN